MIASNFFHSPSASTTPSGVNRSMPPPILMEPSLILSSVPTSINGTRPCSSTIWRGPLAAAQSQLFYSTDGQPQYRRVDQIDQPRRQTLIQNGPRQDRKAQEIAGQDLNRSSNRQRDIDAGVRQVQRDF